MVSPTIFRISYPEQVMKKPAQSNEVYIRDGVARLAHSIHYKDLPPAAIREAKRLIIDTLACAYGGFASPPSKIVRATVDELGGTPESTIIGTGQKTSCAMATLANGTMMRYLDNNDYYIGRDPSHTSGNLAPALAMAERQHASGQDLILAFVVAYEIQIRLCDFAGLPNIWERGWHHATNMQFATAALASRLLKLDEKQTANALAIAGSHNNTLAQSQRGNIPMMKASAEATIAKGGVEAALLAKNGLTGPDEIFEGHLGWARCVAGEVDFDKLLRPFDRKHPRILDTCMKPYAAEAMTMAPIQASIDVIQDNNIDTAQIKSVVIRFPHYALNKPSWDPKKFNPQNRETADHSFMYCTAVAMLDGACGPEQFTSQKLASREVRNLMEATKLITDPELTKLWPYSAAGAAEVTLKSGKKFESVCKYPPGHPRNRCPDAVVEGKFERLSRTLLTDAQRRNILDAIWTIDKCQDVSEFMKLLTV